MATLALPLGRYFAFQYLETVSLVFGHRSENIPLSVFAHCEDSILLFSKCILKVLGVMWYCQVSSAGVCSKIALVTKAMRWYIILRRSALYLGKLVAKAM